MSLGQLIGIIRARWWVVVTVLLATAGLVIGVSLILPKKFTAAASVVVDSKPDPLSAVAYGSGISAAFMATQIDIIESDRVALRVVRNLKLAENPNVREQWTEDTGGTGSIEQWLSESFKRRMVVKPSRESNVLTISYTAPDPKFAAALANAFVQAYVDTALELRTDPAKRYSTFFDTRVKDARETLEAAQARLSAFQRDKGIIATDERVDIETSRLNELSTQLVAIEAVAAESSSRQSQAAGEGGEKMPEVLNNGLIAGIKSDINRNESRLQELTLRLGDNHPQVIEAKATLDGLRRKLDVETRRVTGGVGLTNNINRQRERQIRSELDAQRAKVLRLRGVRDESSVLLRDVENAQRTYDALQSRLNATSLESQATQGNISVLTEAAPPAEASSPKVFMNSILGVFFGLLFGVGAVLLLEFRDRRVRSAEDLELLDIPLIGVLPAQGSSRASRRDAQQLMNQRIVGRLSAPARGG